MVTIAKTAGYDSIFIDLEHSQFSLEQSARLCSVANMNQVSPFVRIPHECGNGFVQRVLDADARGIIAPHLHNAQDAHEVLKMVKYPPLGQRSINPSLLDGPAGAGKLGGEEARARLQSVDALVFVQIETKEALHNLDEIAATPIDVLLIGSMDMSLELGVLAQWDHELYQDVLERVSQAAKRHSKQWGVSGLFGRPDRWKQIFDLGGRFIVGALDLGLMTGAAVRNCKMLRDAVEA